MPWLRHNNIAVCALIVEKGGSSGGRALKMSRIIKEKTKKDMASITYY